MISGPLVLALLVAQDADHEIGVGHIAATAKCAEHVPATCQERQGIRRLSLLSAYLGEKECRLGLTVMIAEPPAELKDLFEAGCSVGYSALPPVGARESGQAVCLFFFNDPATTEIYTLSLHDALPISRDAANLEHLHQRAEHLEVEGLGAR